MKHLSPLQMRFHAAMLYCNAYGAGLREQPPSKENPQTVQRNIARKNVYLDQPRTSTRSHFALTLPPHLGHGLILWNLTRLTSLKRRVQIHLFDTRTLL